MKELDLFKDLRKMTNECVSNIVTILGSPDVNEDIVLKMKSNAIIHSFDGAFDVELLMIRNIYETTELQFHGRDNNGEYQIYTPDTLPVEGCIELIDHVARQFDLDEMSKILESY